MKETLEHWPGPLWWWAVRCGWWPRPSWPYADACPPSCWWGPALPWFHWPLWCRTGPGEREESMVNTCLLINNNFWYYHWGGTRVDHYHQMWPLLNNKSFLFTSLVYPFSVGDWPIVIFLRNRSLVSNTEVKQKDHMTIIYMFKRLNPQQTFWDTKDQSLGPGIVSNVHTSLPGDRAWVNVQSSKAGDLFFSQSGGVSLLYTQFLHKYRNLQCLTWTISSVKTFSSVMWSLTLSLLIWMGENFLCPPLSGTKRLYRAYRGRDNRLINL